MERLETGGIQFPIKHSDIPKLERLNNIRINVFGYDYSPEQPEDRVLNTGTKL